MKKITSKERKQIETYAAKIKKWHERVQVGKESQTYEEQKRYSVLENLYTKKGKLRKNISALKSAELLKEAQFFRRSKWSSQRKRSEIYKSVKSKKIKTLSSRGEYQELTPERKKEAASKAIALFDIFVKNNDIFGSFMYDSSNVIDLSANYEAIKTSDIQKLAEYIHCDRQDKYPTFLQQAQYIDDDFNALTDLLDIMEEEGFKSADKFIEKIEKVKENYDKYEERLNSGEKLHDLIKEVKK